MKFSLQLTKQQIADTYQTVLKDAAAALEIKGFRKGKVPVSVAADHLDKAKLYEEVVNRALPDVYLQYVKSHDLKPIVSPRINIKSAKDNEDWFFEAEIAEKPEVTLNHYQDAIKTAKAKDAIWTPGKPLKTESPDNPDKPDDESKKLTFIFDILLKTCTLDVPPLLIDNEVEHSLSRLLNQIDKLGLTLDQYLKSLNTTVEKLREEYHVTADANLKLEFILSAIADDQKLSASADELQEFTDKITDLKVKSQLSQDSDARASLSYSITKRKVVDYLKSL